VRLLELLEARPVVVMDGAMGTRLMTLGLEPGECGDAWNLKRPNAVEEVLRSYAEAGADCVLTNTFGANPIALSRHGLEAQTEAINRAGVELARRAAGEQILVIGGMGPTGGLLEPYGDLPAERIRQAFARQAEVLADAGADAVLCETFESGDEIKLALQGAREACGLPLIASMKFNREPSGRYRTMMGEAPSRLVAVAGECRCTAVGSNCGRGIEELIPLVAELRGLTDLPLFAEPNAGMPRLVDGDTIYDEGPDAFSRFLPRLHDAGARIIGGCCGTTADHIRAIREFADSL
jgi:5-methyltetrahydrofolate--homocysteine methyltransferase